VTRISRRNFAKHAVVIAGAAAVLPDVLAQNPPATDPAPAAAAPSGAANAEVDARVSWIVNRHGVRLSAEQRADIRRLIAGAQPGFEAMRAYELPNSVDPATPFRIWRADRDSTTAKRNLVPVTTHERRDKD
jgi:hypothetical protein